MSRREPAGAMLPRGGSSGRRVPLRPPRRRGKGHPPPSSGHACARCRRPPIAVAAVDAAWADPSWDSGFADASGTSGSGGRRSRPAEVGGTPGCSCRGRRASQAGWRGGPRAYLAVVTRGPCFDPFLEGFFFPDRYRTPTVRPVACAAADKQLTGDTFPFENPVKTDFSSEGR